MKVRTLANNQYVITGEGKTVFQSYDSTIAVIDYNKEGSERLTLGRDWNYSNTTAKYLYKFLDEYMGIKVNKKGLETAIKNKDICFDACLA